MDAELEEIEGEIEVETGEAMDGKMELLTAELEGARKAGSASVEEVEVEEEANGSGLSSSVCSSFPSIVSLSSAIVTLDFLGAGPTLESEGGEGEGALAIFRELDITRFYVKMQCVIRNVLNDFERNIFFYDSMRFWTKKAGKKKVKFN